MAEHKRIQTGLAESQEQKNRAQAFRPQRKMVKAHCFSTGPRRSKAGISRLLNTDWRSMKNPDHTGVPMVFA